MPVEDVAIRLTAAGKPLDTTSNRLGRLLASDPALPIEELRARYARDGYIWLKGLLDPRDVNDFRGWAFSDLAGTGLLRPGSAPAMGLAGPAEPDRPDIDRRLARLVRTARFEGFCADRRLAAFIDAFIGGSSALLKRKMMRLTRPGSGVATPAHYDLIYLRGGSSDLVTAWIPVGDISVAEGGLAYLEGSHTLGQQMERDFSARNADLSPEERISAYNVNMSKGGWVSKDLPDMAEKFDARWLIADYEAGDVVLHSPFMIHASTDNVSETGRIRLSIDIRFQDVDSAIDARWGNHWFPGDNL
ncbi:MAG: phytanoyl-CoA dioxygenase family protein [Rubellimicrobium sp.]|nr:phytanoyl-CoA dioxygenase family protein [Rubellimicrobium sp.]